MEIFYFVRAMKKLLNCSVMFLLEAKTSRELWERSWKGEKERDHYSVWRRALHKQKRIVNIPNRTWAGIISNRPGTRKTEDGPLDRLGSFHMSLLLPIISLQPFISPTDIWKVDNLSANIYILNLVFWGFYFSGAGWEKVKKEMQSAIQRMC